MKRLLYIVCLCLLAASCSPGKEQKSAALPVRTARPETVSATDRLRTFPFISRPYHESVLSFRISGPVNAFDVQPGAYFRKGETIASIDSRDFAVELSRSKAVLQHAEEEYDRIDALFAKGNISGSSYEKAKADLAVAQSSYDNARNALADTRLTAPFDGYVQDVLIEPYQDVKATQAAFTFIDLGRIKAEVYITEEVAAYIRSRGSRPEDVKVVFDGRGKELTPQSIHISGSTTRNNLSYILTAVVDNRQADMPGGMSGEIVVNMPAVAGTSVMLLPQTAVCHSDSKGDHVWLASDGQAMARSVTLGKLSGDKVEILAGLEGGEDVILTKQTFLSEGTEVKTF